MSYISVSCVSFFFHLLIRSECHPTRSSFRSARVRVVVYCQPSATSEIAESMLILESPSITDQRLRVSLSVSLPVLNFLSYCVWMFCRLSEVIGYIVERSERYKVWKRIVMISLSVREENLFCDPSSPFPILMTFQELIVLNYYVLNIFYVLCDALYSIIFFYFRWKDVSMLFSTWSSRYHTDRSYISLSLCVRKLVVISVKIRSKRNVHFLLESEGIHFCESRQSNFWWRLEGVTIRTWSWLSRSRVRCIVNIITVIIHRILLSVSTKIPSFHLGKRNTYDPPRAIQ